MNHRGTQNPVQHSPHNLHAHVCACVCFGITDYSGRQPTPLGVCEGTRRGVATQLEFFFLSSATSFIPVFNPITRTEETDHNRKKTVCTCSITRLANKGLNPTASSMLPQKSLPAPLHRAATEPTNDWNWSDCIVRHKDWFRG